MAFKLFAAIDVGSFEIGMKIFELSQKKGVTEIDSVRRRIELGTDTYTTGKISYSSMDELCGILNGFKEIMQGYRVDAYRACGTSAVRETENTSIIIDQIRIRTGIEVQPLSNSEQRFLDYKSVALKSGGRFDKITRQGTAIIDIGGGSTQVSLFDAGRLICTANLHLGILRLRERMDVIEARRPDYEKIFTELIDTEIRSFRELYLSDLDIQNIIVVDDNMPYIMRNLGDKEAALGQATAESFLQFVDILKSIPEEQMAKKVGIPVENASLLLPSALLVKNFISAMGATRLWIPGISLSDGIAYDYAERNKYIHSSHDFEKDIISCVNSISRRYHGSRIREEGMVRTAMAIFDGMKKLHGLTRRERLLLEISARLRDCGRFVSLANSNEMAYSIIMGTEIIGISHAERKMIAAVVRDSYTVAEFYYEKYTAEGFSDQQFLAMSRLIAILGVSAGVAKSTGKEILSARAALKDKELIITVDTEKDIKVEQKLLPDRIKVFEEVFGIHPVLRQKKDLHKKK